MRRFEFDLFADYFQFYIQDESVSGDLSSSWTEQATERLLAVAPGVVGVGTARNMSVPVTVEITDAEPALDIDAWDHITACSLEVQSGRIVIAGFTDYFPDAARLELAPGCYNVRVSYADLKSLSEDRLEGKDHYRVQLWKGVPVGPHVVKQRDV